MKKYKYILLALLVLGIAGAGIYGYRLYNKPHRGIADEKPAFTLTDKELADSFEGDAAAQHQKLNNQVIVVSGTVKKMQEENGFTSLSMDPGGEYVISVTLDEKETAKPEAGKTISVKGLYVGHLEGEPDFGIPGEIKLKNGFIQ
ncbi:MAG: hypothetical protein MH137_00675 [Flavobacteriales bacterium]|nr:hypothetical protein [Flavobacteriales bacterium]